MGRKSTFEKNAVYAAVGVQVAEKGSFTLQNLSAATGMSTGSVYHRFASREALLAETWLHAVELFQSGFLEALRSSGRDAGEQAALSTPRFCRANPDAAIVLTCCRRQEFIGPDTPVALAKKIASVNDKAKLELRRFSRRNNLPLLTCRLAIVAYPLAAVKLFLPHKKVPGRVDEEISKAYYAVMSRD